jgi:DNA modification methylase
MTPWLDDGDVKLYHGDVMDVLRQLEPTSVQTCVTSPPYWGLRDYGEDGQIGLEATPGEYVARMVQVFREVRRVLRDDGTLWVNLGDSYAANRGGTYQPAETLAGGVSGRMPDGTKTNRGRGDGYMPSRDAAAHGLKHKDLVGIPWRVAFALQDDGWYLRADIIWAKPNPMPESVTDRPTKSHEYLFLLTKSPRYFYDHAAVREPLKSTPEQYLRAGKSVRENHALGQVAGRSLGAGSFATVPDGRNARSVWNIATRSYAGAHFATFPVELPERCIKAGSAPGDVVLDPFSGSGTTAWVARHHGRRAVGIELNEDYLRLSADRLRQLSLLGDAVAGQD